MSEYRPIDGLAIWVFRNEHEEKAIHELERMSDRAGAIVGAALLEHHVEAILKQEVNGGDEEAFKEFFTGSGVLAAFGARIKLLYLLGLLTKQAWKDLDNIAKIRNEFAHKLSVNTFNDDAVINRCLNLKMVEQFVMEPDVALRSEKTHDCPRTVFEGAAKTLKDPRSKFFLSISTYTLAFNKFPRLGRREPYL